MLLEGPGIIELGLHKRKQQRLGGLPSAAT